MGAHSYEELRGVHAGQSALVMGAGPSLLNITPAMASRHVSIAVNDSIGRFPRPDYYATADPMMLGRRHWEVVQKSTCRIIVAVGFMSNDLLADLGPEKERGGVDSGRVYAFQTRDPQERTWSTSADDTQVLVGSSVHSAVNMAVIMGCDPVYIAGCDCQIVDGKRYYWQFQDGGFCGDFTCVPLQKARDHREGPSKELEFVLLAWKLIGTSSTVRLLSVSGGLLEQALPSARLEDL